MGFLMGYDIGSFKELRYTAPYKEEERELHVECTKGLVYIWTTPETQPIMRLAPDQAQKLSYILECASIYYPDYQPNDT